MALACSPLDNITGIPGACCAHMSHCGWSSCDLGQLDASLCRGASTKLTLKSLLLARQLERAAHAGRDPALLGALRRAAAGEPLVIWGIGGSTTQGRDSPVTYGHLFARWLSSALPVSLEHAPEGSYRGHLYMPHARSSTGSAGFVDAVPAMGRQRGYRGLIRQTGWTGVREGRPDLILMEHGVNDVDYTRGVWKTVDLRQGCSTPQRQRAYAPPPVAAAAESTAAPPAARSLEALVRALRNNSFTRSAALVATEFFPLGKFYSSLDTKCGYFGAEDDHRPVLKHYGMPVVSLRDAIWPDLAGHAGDACACVFALRPELQPWLTVWNLTGVNHANLLGHSLVADLLSALVIRTLERGDRGGAHAAAPAAELPPPLLLPAESGGGEVLTFLDAEDAGSNEAAFPAARRRGFTYRADTREAYGWIGEGVGDAIEFELRGDAHRAATTVCFNYLKSYRHMGSVRASVDGGESRVLDALWTAPASLKQEECIAGVRAKATHVLRLEIVECGRAENKIKVTRVTSRAAADL